MADSIGGRLNSQKGSNFLPGARNCTIGKQVRLCPITTRFCRLHGMTESHHKFSATVFKQRLRQAIGRHFPPYGGNTRIAIFSVGQGIRHHSQSRIPQIRPGMSQLFHGGSSIQATWAVDFQSVCEEIQLHRGSLGIAAIVPMNQGVQNRFPQGVDEIYAAGFVR